MALDLEKIEKQLPSLPKEASVAFAYRCALRSVPLLAAPGNFKYWGEDQEKHLFAVFHGLDGLEGLFHGIQFAASYADDAYAAANAADAYATASTATANDAAASYAAYAYAAAAYAAASAAASAASAAASAAAYAAASTAVGAFNKISGGLSKVFQQVIVRDLEFLQNAKQGADLLKEPLWTSVPVEWPELVARFDDALRAIDLEFWIPIFQDRFQGEPPDSKDLQQRVELPEEIKSQGHRAMLEYVESLQQGLIEKLKEVKVVFLGDGGAGKTSLIHRIKAPNEPLPPNSPPTPGVDIHLWPWEAAEIQAHLWDFGGQVILHATHQFFMSKRSVYVVVLDGRREQDPDYWLHHAQIFGGDSPVLVVINKTDQHQEDLERNTLKKKYPNIQGFFPMSCKDNQGVESFVKQLRQALKTSDSWNTELPRTWYAIKQELQTLDEPHISLETYQTICHAHGVDKAETREVLLRHLNDLGVVIHFEKLEHLNTYVLNPGWLTNAVYRVINSEALRANQGIIALDDLTAIFCQGEEAGQIPQNKHRFLMEAMEKFELAYPLHRDSKEHGQPYLIPDLLNPDEPEELDFQTSGGMLRFCFSFPFLPTSVMARFIVRTAEDLDGQLRWRSGVVLKNTSLNSRALIQANNDQRKIEVWVKGEQQRDHFALIRDHFHKIFHSYAHFTYREEVPLTEDGQHKADYADLLGNEAMGLDTYVLGALKQEFDLKTLLNGIESPTQRQSSPFSKNIDPKRAAMSPAKNAAEIFISYSHPDRKCLDRLLEHLEALEHEGFRYWYDQKIQAGSLWNDEIEQAVEGCKVAVFLVSKASLKSKFIREREVPVLQKRRVTLIPILLDTCGWQVVGWLKQLQFINATPLSKMTDEECEEIFVEVLTQVHQALV